MKVILRQEYPSLGRMGDIVTVKNGYARNFLIPRSIAYLATPGALNAIEIEKKRFAKRLEKERISAEEIAAKVSELQISVAMKVGEEGKLYGSVTPQMISAELAKLGFEVDRRNIIIDDPIKTLGVFDVKVRLHASVIANVKTWVIAEEETVA
ncbi:MAG: 50S ribosomal protein L9 [Candidatus Kapabacteria bacterium]|nr:50S ribosomal protein L9 [Candidatus Kapabacteria bacterium]